MEKLHAWISGKRGRATELAVALAVPASFVTKMATGARPIPIVHMARIEELTSGAVTRRDLRPDDWQDIWPELADSQPITPTAQAIQAPAAINSEAKEAACLTP